MVYLQYHCLYIASLKNRKRNWFNSRVHSIVSYFIVSTAFITVGIFSISPCFFNHLVYGFLMVLTILKSKKYLICYNFFECVHQIWLNLNDTLLLKLMAWCMYFWQGLHLIIFVPVLSFADDFKACNIYYNDNSLVLYIRNNISDVTSG